MRIYLIGFMGVGKTYLGSALAKQLGFGFLDLDESIERKAGKSISSYFEQFGEHKFRQLETECLHETIAWDHHVIATGGGAPCFNQNMEWMNEHGITIFLNAGSSILTTRLAQEAAKRPLVAKLTKEELAGFVSKKLEERMLFYGQAQVQFEASQSGLDGIDVLAKYLKRFFKKKMKCFKETQPFMSNMLFKKTYIRLSIQFENNKTTMTMILSH
ncbi:MAG: shikimate kinase [Saprospiraceae bacterium]|nr:shikimate kinase [Saprospiraceae bacterium]